METSTALVPLGSKSWATVYLHGNIDRGFMIGCIDGCVIDLEKSTCFGLQGIAVFALALSLQCELEGLILYYPGHPVWIIFVHLKQFGQSWHCYVPFCCPRQHLLRVVQMSIVCENEVTNCLKNYEAMLPKATILKKKSYKNFISFIWDCSYW